MSEADMRSLEGQCLCGAVQVKARGSDLVLRACHCDMCRRHTSAMFMSISADPESVEITGPAQSFQSSEWAERGFCSTCGSTLWYGTQADGKRHLAAGLFEGAGGAFLTLEFFSDMCPQGYRLEGVHRRLSTDQTIEMFTGGTAA